MNSITYSVNNRHSRSFFSSLGFLFFLAVVMHGSLLTAHAARSVSFTWNANPEAVDGYRLYYRAGSSGPPYNGIGAIEGSSPVATGNVTIFTLHGLSDTETYYFVLTAYKGAQESGYTKEIILAPVAPVPPGNTPPSAAGASFSTMENARFSAKLSATDPDGDPLTYRIIRNGSLGSAVISNSSTGAFTYTPSPGAAGNDTFTFRVNDGTGDSNTATVNILITALNNAPSVVISTSASVGVAPFQVQFNGTGSRDSDGTISTYLWDFGDGTTATGAIVSHTYSAAGTYTAKLTVTDNSGKSAAATTPIVVTTAGNVPPRSVISVSTASGTVPLPVRFNGAGSYDPDGSIASYRWNFNDGTIAYGRAVNHVFSSAGIYRVTLRVTDNKGASSSITRTITAQAEGTAVVEKNKFPWDLFLPIIQRNIANRKSNQKGE